MASILNWSFFEVDRAFGKSVGINLKVMWWVPANNFFKISPGEPVISKHEYICVCMLIMVAAHIVGMIYCYPADTKTFHQF